MCELLTFIIITIIFFFAGICALKLFFKMIQPEGALDMVCGWQNMLERFYAKGQAGNKFYVFLEKALGGCPHCTAFWFMGAWYGCYYGFCKIAISYWITDNIESWWKIIFINCVWWVVFWAQGGVVGLFVLLKNKKNGV